MTELSINDLKERGWTQAMIDRFLGKEDWRNPVDHWANYSGIKVWTLKRVEAAETTPEFSEFFTRSASRRKLSAEKIDEVYSRINKLRQNRIDL